MGRDLVKLTDRALHKIGHILVTFMVELLFIYVCLVLNDPSKLVLTGLYLIGMGHDHVESLVWPML